MSGLDQARFREVLGHFATGVTIVTALEEGVPVGFTCQTFGALSLDPPMVILAPARSSTSWPRIAKAGAFCVNILGEHQEALCRSFAVSGGDPTQFWAQGRMKGFEDGIKANFDALIAMGDLTQPPPLAGFIDASFLAEAAARHPGGPPGGGFRRHQCGGAVVGGPHRPHQRDEGFARRIHQSAALPEHVMPARHRAGQ